MGYEQALLLRLYICNRVIYMRLTDGLIDFLQNSMNRIVVITIKENIDKSLSGQLIGFDESVLLLNPFDGSTPAKLLDTPTFIDMESICVIASASRENFESYGRAFDSFRQEYAKKQKRMSVMEATETI